MADLREQMLKAGLINSDQAKRAEHEKRQEKKKLGHEGREKKQKAQRHEAKQQIQAKAAEDKQRNQAQQRTREDQDQVKAGRQQKQALIQRCLKEGALPRWEGNRSYYFRDGDQVLFLNVNDHAQKELEAGKAAIVRGEGRRYAVIVSGFAKELLEGAPERVVTFHRN
jgi:uncharacterized protein YaiL (DUF2058 family)